MPKTVIDMSGDADDTRTVIVPAQNDGTTESLDDQSDTTDTDVEPEAEIETGTDIEIDETDPDLDSDPNTSLVGSLSLHMLSEHGIGGVLHLDDAALIQEHQKAHRESGQPHGIADDRFRPQKALAAALLACQTPPEPAPASM